MSPGRLIVAPHWRAFGVWYLAILIIGTGPINNPEAILTPIQGLIIAILIGAGVAIKSKTSLLTVTPEKIERVGGLFDRRALSWPTSNLAEVKVIAGVASRLLGIGHLVLIPKDESPMIKFWGVENARKIMAEIERIAGLGEAE